MRKDETDPIRWTQISPKLWGRMIDHDKAQPALQLCAGPGGDTEIVTLKVDSPITTVTLSLIVAVLQAAKMSEDDLLVGKSADCPTCPFCNANGCEQRGKHEIHWHARCGSNSELPVNWRNDTPRRQVPQAPAFTQAPITPTTPTGIGMGGPMKGAPGEDVETAEEIEARVANLGKSV